MTPPATPGPRERTGSPVASRGQFAGALLRSLIAASWAGLAIVSLLVLVSIATWIVVGLDGVDAQSPNRGQLVDVIRTAIMVWVSAHGVPLQLEAGLVHIVPMFVTVLLVLFFSKSGQWFTRQYPQLPVMERIAALVLTAMAGGAVLTVVTTIAGSQQLSASAVVVFLAGFLLTGLGMGVGVVREIAHTITSRDTAKSTASPVKLTFLRCYLLLRVSVVVTGIVALLLILAFALLRLPALTQAFIAWGQGPIAITGVAVIMLAFLPNLMVWVLGLSVGTPVFLLGGASVSIFSSQPGTVPAIPPLMVIPEELPGGLFLILLPILASALAHAWLLWRRSSLTPTWRLQLVHVSVVSVSSAVLFAVMAWLASGFVTEQSAGVFGIQPLPAALVWGVAVFLGLCPVGVVMSLVQHQRQ